MISGNTCLSKVDLKMIHKHNLWLGHQINLGCSCYGLVTNDDKPAEILTEESLAFVYSFEETKTSPNDYCRSCNNEEKDEPPENRCPAFENLMRKLFDQQTRHIDDDLIMTHKHNLWLGHQTNPASVL